MQPSIHVMMMSKAIRIPARLPRDLASDGAETGKESAISFGESLPRIQLSAEDDLPKLQHGAERSAYARNIHGGWVRNRA